MICRSPPLENTHTYTHRDTHNLTQTCRHTHTMTHKHTGTHINLLKELSTNAKWLAKIHWYLERTCLLCQVLCKQSQQKPTRLQTRLSCFCLGRSKGVHGQKHYYCMLCCTWKLRFSRSWNSNLLVSTWIWPRRAPQFFYISTATFRKLCEGRCVAPHWKLRVQANFSNT